MSGIISLNYQLWKSEGPEQAKVMLLHGMGGTGALWRPIAAALESDISVLAPDQRGHGGSRLDSVHARSRTGAATPGYAPIDYGRDLSELVDKLAFSPCWVVGHSMGVRSACALAHLRPDVVRGLILVDLGFSGPAGGGLGEGLANFLRVLPMRFESRSLARSYMESNCPDLSIGQYLLAVSVPDGSSGGITFPFDRDALIETIHATRDISVRDWVLEAAERGMPILSLRGAESQVWSHEDFEAERARLGGYTNVSFETMEGTGHGLPFEKRAQFVKRVREWVQKAL